MDSGQFGAVRPGSCPESDTPVANTRADTGDWFTMKTSGPLGGWPIDGSGPPREGPPVKEILIILAATPLTASIGSGSQPATRHASPAPTSGPVASTPGATPAGAPATAQSRPPSSNAGPTDHHSGRRRPGHRSRGNQSSPVPASASQCARANQPLRGRPSSRRPGLPTRAANVLPTVVKHDFSAHIPSADGGRRRLPHVGLDGRERAALIAHYQSASPAQERAARTMAISKCAVGC